jgi:hypothetical protein
MNFHDEWDILAGRARCARRLPGSGACLPQRAGSGVSSRLDPTNACLGRSGRLLAGGLRS